LRSLPSPESPFPLSFPTRRSSDLPSIFFIFSCHSSVSHPALGDLRRSRLILAQLLISIPAGQGMQYPQPRQKSPVNSVLSASIRSEEHTSELQSRFDLVCRLLLEE